MDAEQITDEIFRWHYWKGFSNIVLGAFFVGLTFESFKIGFATFAILGAATYSISARLEILVPAMMEAIEEAERKRKGEEREHSSYYRQRSRREENRQFIFFLILFIVALAWTLWKASR